MKRFLRAIAVTFVLPFIFMGASCGQNEELLRCKSTSIQDLESYETALAEEHYYYEEDWAFITNLLAETKEKINAKETKTSEEIAALCAEAKSQIDSISPMKFSWVIYGLQEAFDLGLLTRDDLIKIADFTVLEPKWSKKERNAIENAYAGYLPEEEQFLYEYLADTEDEYVFCGKFHDSYAVYRAPLQDREGELEEELVDGVYIGNSGFIKLWKLADAEESKPMVIENLRREMPWSNLYSESLRQWLQDLFQETKEKINSAGSYKTVVSLCEEAKEKINSAEKKEEVIVKIDGQRAECIPFISHGEEVWREPSYEQLRESASPINGTSHTVTVEFSGDRSNPGKPNYGTGLYEELPRKITKSFSDDLVVDFGDNLWKFEIELSKELEEEGILVLQFFAWFTMEFAGYEKITFFIPMKVN